MMEIPTLRLPLDIEPFETYFEKLPTIIRRMQTKFYRTSHGIVKRDDLALSLLDITTSSEGKRSLSIEDIGEITLVSAGHFMDVDPVSAKRTYLPRANHLIFAKYKGIILNTNSSFDERVLIARTTGQWWSEQNNTAQRPLERQDDNYGVSFAMHEIFKNERS